MLIAEATALLTAVLVASATTQVADSSYATSAATNLGPEEGVMRRDPSDIVKVNDLYYIWYSKGAFSHGYDATVWYATSPDGHTWEEQGEALARGPKGSWDEQSVFTPNILAADGKYWLFYTGVGKPFVRRGPKKTPAAIGVAVADSPDGPWKKVETNPILQPSGDDKDFDGLRLDDACLIVRDGKYWLYYKGVQSYRTTPQQTKMGVAIAEQPQGPYVKHPSPVVSGGHEVLVWPYGQGVVALITTAGASGVVNTLQYAEDGITFSKMADLEKCPNGGGAFRPEAFTDSGQGKMIDWGVHIKTKKGSLPSLERFDYEWK